MSTPESYFAAVESYFVERRGSPLFITPKEWHLVAEWERLGIPLEVVQEAIDTVFERPKTRHRRRTLAYCRQSVEAAFRRFKEARLGGRTEEALEVEHDVLRECERLVTMLGRAAESSPHALAEALRSAAREVEALARSGMTLARMESRLSELDEALVGALDRGVDPEKRRALEREATRTLASYRERMPEDVYDAAVRSAFLRRLRATFGLSRLSLY